MKRQLRSRVEPGVIFVSGAGVDIGDQVLELKSALVPAVSESVDDLVDALREFVVVGGVFVDVLANVVAHRVFHLRRFGPVRADFVDVGSERGVFDTQTGTGCGEDVFVAAVDVVGLGDEGLSSRLGVIGRAESRLAAMKSQVLAEVERRHDTTAAQRVARHELQSSKREAKRDVESAVRLSELSATSQALESGEIPQGHARLIARASGEGDIDETVLLQAAGEQDFDAFVKTVRRHQQDQSKDDGQTILDRQRKNRNARIFESAESGMFVLSGEFDQITGARIATALTAKERQLWHSEDPKKRRKPAQRMADALAELICEPTSGGSQGTDLLVIADFDVINQRLVNARLADGSSIPIGELHRMALDANILPSIFDAKAQNMWLGRHRRTASEAQRIALIARDQHCVGCGANPLWCRAHHIIWWRDGGSTDFDNLLLVCDDCHHKIHEDGWTVHQHPKTHRYHLKPPNQSLRPTGTREAVQPTTENQTETFTEDSGRSNNRAPVDQGLEAEG